MTSCSRFQSTGLGQWQKDCPAGTRIRLTNASCGRGFYPQAALENQFCSRCCFENTRPDTPGFRTSCEEGGMDYHVDSFTGCAWCVQRPKKTTINPVQLELTELKLTPPMLGLGNWIGGKRWSR